MPREPNPNFMAGVPELMILRLLQDREMYGYELVQAIKTESADVISFGEGVVYPVLHGLEDDGAVTSRRKLVDGRSRVYYTLTAKGERRYRQLADTWSSLAQAIQSVLKGSRYATGL
ncbi:MAG TPA: PadR family transcriptional regulator [Steroidobacteraceae bacterium]|jgi:PadR family transcriptional regulator PadR|nr:PadR family transcriptional regulator [Steroidobacteraceae bacterium]